MAVNSRAKGARGERLFRDFLREMFNDAEAARGQQKKGGDQSPDVESPMLRMLKIHPEVKFMADCAFTQKATLRDWLAQANRDAAGDYTAVVFHRWTRSEWWAIYLTPGGNTCIMLAEEYLDEALNNHKGES